MGWTLQLNPRAEARHVSPDLISALDHFLKDFELRYCALEPSRDLVSALRSFRPRYPEEAVVIAELLTELESGAPVELLLGY